jgi:hypothetical protein
MYIYGFGFCRDSNFFGELHSSDFKSVLTLSNIFFFVSQWLIYPDSAILHVTIGAISGIVVVLAILYDEPELMHSIVVIVKKRMGKVD